MAAIYLADLDGRYSEVVERAVAAAKALHWRDAPDNDDAIGGARFYISEAGEFVLSWAEIDRGCYDDYPTLETKTMVLPLDAIEMGEADFSEWVAALDRERKAASEMAERQRLLELKRRELEAYEALKAKYG